MVWYTSSIIIKEKEGVKITVYLVNLYQKLSGNSCRLSRYLLSLSLSLSLSLIILTVN
jgi:hypothetical protein